MLSVIINTKNAAKTLARTLESVKFADEVVVVDQHSSDQTREIAKHHGAKVFLFDDLGRVEPEARNFALSQVTKPWILMVDADEVVPSSLANKIKNLVRQSPKSIGGFLIPRKNFIFGDWIKHSGWWPDYQLRLFRKEGAAWQAGVHSQVKIEGEIKRLPAKPDLALVHHNYTTIGDFLERLDRYSTLKANEQNELNDNQERVGQKLIELFFQEFVRRLFYYQAYLDGGRGVGLSFLQSMHELVILLKRWEAAGFVELKKNQSRAVMEAMSQVRKDLAYWLADYQVKNSSGLKQFYWRLRRKLKI